MNYDPLYIAGMHEAKHCGVFYALGIEVTAVAVRADGSGYTRKAGLDCFAFPTLYRQDRHAALRLVVAHMAGALAPSLGHPEEINQCDLGYVQDAGELWASVASSPTAYALCDQAAAKARLWLRSHEEACASFARQLCYRRSLSHKELQERLSRTFGSPAAHTSTTRPAPATAGPLPSVWDVPHFRWTGKPRRSINRAMYHNPNWRTGGVCALPTFCVV